MKRAWAGLGSIIERLTLRRIAIALPLLTLFGGGLLALSVLLESGPWEVLALPEAEPGPWPADLAHTPPAAVALASALGAPAELSPSPEPTAGEATATPQPAATSTPLPLGEGDLNIVLLGTDQRPGRDSSWRTDAIILVAVRPGAHLVALFSIPRDLWVAIPGYGPQRINVADFAGERAYGAGGGPRLLGATLRENLGIPVHAYARVNFAGLVRIVDALGGITVDVERPFDEWLDHGTPQAWHLRLDPGRQRLDGRTALGYARSRQQSSDLDRSRRQQQILLGMRDAALRPAVVPQLPQLVTALSDAVDTNLTPGQVLSLLRLVPQIDSASYRQRVFDKTMVRDWVTPEGAMVLLPDRERIEQVWAELTVVEP